MPGFKVSNGATYVDPKGISVSNGSAYVAAKGVYVSQGNGTWTPVWPLLSTVSLSAPAYAVSTASGSNSTAQSWNTIVSPTFTVTLSNPSAVSSVSLQLSITPGSWVQYENWTTGITGTLSKAIPLYNTGTWSARAVITHTSGSQVTSNITSTVCTAFNISAGANTLTPQVGVQTNVWAAMSPGAPAGFPNTPEGWYISLNDQGFAYRPSSPWGWSNTANPLYWTPGDNTVFTWIWVESFPDGSRIHSDIVRQAPWTYVPPPTEVVAPNAMFEGGALTTSALQAAMTYARGQGLPLRIAAGYNWPISGDVWIPDGLTVSAYGAGFSMSTGRFRNSGRWPAASMTSEGGYDGGGFTWSGGEFNGGGDGIFTLSHCPWATIQGATMYHWAVLGNTGHAIEINSSGGLDNASGEYGTYNINILGNNFGGLVSQRTNGNDEAVSYDYAWDGSGNAGADDHTMCHNVKVDGNTFHQQWGGGEFVKCAIGGHDNGTYTPPERHNHFTFRNNAIHGSQGSDGTNPDKGVIHLYWVRSSWVVFNAFYGCNSNRLMQIELSAENSTASPYYNFTGGSTSNTGGSPNAWTSVNTADSNT